MISILFAFIPPWSKEVRQGGLLEDRERLRDGHLRLLRVLDRGLVLRLLLRADLRRLGDGLVDGEDLGYVFSEFWLIFGKL